MSDRVKAIADNKALLRKPYPMEPTPALIAKQKKKTVSTEKVKAPLFVANKKSSEVALITNPEVKIEPQKQTNFLDKAQNFLTAFANTPSVTADQATVKSVIRNAPKIKQAIFNDFEEGAKYKPDPTKETVGPAIQKGLEAYTHNVIDISPIDGALKHVLKNEKLRNYVAGVFAGNFNDKQSYSQMAADILISTPPIIGTAMDIRDAIAMGGELKTDGLTLKTTVGAGLTVAAFFGLDALTKPLKKMGADQAVAKLVTNATEHFSKHKNILSDAIGKTCDNIEEKLFGEVGALRKFFGGGDGPNGYKFATESAPPHTTTLPINNPPITPDTIDKSQHVMLMEAGNKEGSSLTAQTSQLQNLHPQNQFQYIRNGLVKIVRDAKYAAYKAGDFTQKDFDTFCTHTKTMMFYKTSYAEIMSNVTKNKLSDVLKKRQEIIRSIIDPDRKNPFLILDDEAMIDAATKSIPAEQLSFNNLHGKLVTLQKIDEEFIKLVDDDYLKFNQAKKLDTPDTASTKNNTEQQHSENIVKPEASFVKTDRLGPAIITPSKTKKPVSVSFGKIHNAYIYSDSNPDGVMSLASSVFGSKLPADLQRIIQSEARPMAGFLKDKTGYRYIGIGQFHNPIGIGYQKQWFYQARHYLGVKHMTGEMDSFRKNPLADGIDNFDDAIRFIEEMDIRRSAKISEIRATDDFYEARFEAPTFKGLKYHDIDLVIKKPEWAITTEGIVARNKYMAKLIKEKILNKNEKGIGWFGAAHINSSYKAQQVRPGEITISDRNKFAPPIQTYFDDGDFLAIDNSGIISFFGIRSDIPAVVPSNIFKDFFLYDPEILSNGYHLNGSDFVVIKPTEKFM